MLERQRLFATFTCDGPILLTGVDRHGSFSDQGVDIIFLLARVIGTEIVEMLSWDAAMVLPDCGEVICLDMQSVLETTVPSGLYQLIAY